MSKIFMKLSTFSALCLSTVPAWAAQAVDLDNQDVTLLRSFISSPTLAAKTASTVDLNEVNEATDFNGTRHIRIKQTYAGYPVWGGDAVLHIRHGQQSQKTLSGLMASADKSMTMNGTLYQDLQKDLKDTPKDVFSAAQAEKALALAIVQYEAALGKKAAIENKRSRLMVYTDDENKAHWVFYVRFYAKAEGSRPAIPTFLIDAVSFNIYRQWDEVKSLDNVAGGGLGGNLKTGKFIYDGKPGHFPSLDIQRDADKKLCFLRNDEVTVTDYREGENKIASFVCESTNMDYNGLYWDGANDQINGGYSPNHDALYAGKIIRAMYQAWYQTPPLIDSYNKPLMLTMVTHSPNYDEKGEADPDNAYWDPEKKKMYFGDGLTYFYPLTSLGVAAHEISHGFTEQNASLVYDRQSGGMNEAFSDMAAQAAEFYSLGKNSWQIGSEITKTRELPVLRYMDKPSKDCHGGKPGGNPSDKYSQCSIDKATQYYAGLNVHYSSGVYNRAFYLLAKTPGWNVKKAFDVMVTANQHYWVPTTTFVKGACGVVKAAQDYGYDLKAVYQAFDGVGIDAKKCV